MTGVATVDPGRDFVETLARGLLAEHGDDALTLAQARIFLPTRRAVRALEEALPRLLRRPTLLPRIEALGNLDDEESDGFDDPQVSAPPAVGALERRLLLAELVRARPPQGRSVPGAQAMALAGALARLLDEMQTARVDFAALEGLVPDELAEHWRETLEFLTIVIRHWPEILAERGTIDPAARRVRLLEALAGRWRRSPPETPVIAAGSTGSAPAVADLLATVARLPKGLVLLPGLDRGLDDESWAALDETHPQFGLKALLQRLGVERRGVAAWPDPEAPPAPRTALLREVMRPDATVDRWRALGHIGAKEAAGLETVDCPDPRSEAETIAPAMREALETPGRTAALVTADRSLARRVRVELARWNLDVDDSAGQALADTPPGVFLRLTAAAPEAGLAPVPLLAMLKHPLASGGMARTDFRNLARKLDRACLRGPRPAPGFAGLKAALDAARENAKKSDRPFPDGLRDWIGGIASAAAPLEHALAQDRIALAEIVAAHRTFVEWLSADEKGAAGVWAREAGQACRDLFDELAAAARGLRRPLPGRDYPAVLDDALKDPLAALRPVRDRHPRLSIWGPLEARLLRADLTVLGGLNEGTWPHEVAADPWLGRQMRTTLGLMPPERRIGQAAHDFAQLAHAPRVLVTRAAQVDGTPTVKARWLTRLGAVRDGARLAPAKNPWPSLRAALDRPDAPPRPAPPPAPRPPVAARPRRLSVTRVEAWMRDPYEIYARHILELRALDAIDADPAQAEYGTAIHEALARFVEETSGPLPDDAPARLLKTGRETLEATGAPPSLTAFWRPRFERVAEWFVENLRASRLKGVESKVEIEGAWRFDAPGGEFELTARADRLDIRRDGTIDLIDYKTGTPPTEREITAGFAPQLPLTGAILLRDGFPGVTGGALRSLAHWKLSGRDPAGKIVEPRKKSAEELSREAARGVKALAALYDDPDTPYESRPSPRHAPKYSDYEHLARVGEWSPGGADS